MRDWIIIIGNLAAIAVCLVGFALVGRNAWQTWRRRSVPPPASESPLREVNRLVRQYQFKITHEGGSVSAASVEIGRDSLRIVSPIHIRRRGNELLDSSNLASRFKLGDRVEVALLDDARNVVRVWRFIVMHIRVAPIVLDATSPEAAREAVTLGVGQVGPVEPASEQAA